MAGSPDRAADEGRCLTLASQSAADTVEIGREIGRALGRGDVVLLRGPLGAGKTTLTQGIARGLGVADYVTSPTFTLVNEYRPAVPGEHPPLYHVDLYRTSGAVEALEFGLEEYLHGEGLTVVEWAERAAEAMPVDHLLVDFGPPASDDRRTLMVCARGARYDETLARLRKALGNYAARH